jgi:hypothetical protein
LGRGGEDWFTLLLFPPKTTYVGEIWVEADIRKTTFSILTKDDLQYRSGGRFSKRILRFCTRWRSGGVNENE